MADSNVPTPTPSAVSAKDVLAELSRIESKTGGSGAVPNATKTSLLDLTELEARHPDKEFRFVNTGNPDKVSRRKKLGWERLSEAEGGKQLGDLAVFAISKPRLKELRFAKLKRHQELLVSFKKEDHHLAERYSKILKDRYGIDISPQRLIAE